MTAEIHENDIGTQFQVTITGPAGNAVNISGATDKRIIFKKPSGATVSQTADFLNTGTDGIIKYVSASGDLTPVGSWKIQAYVNTPSGEWHSTFKTFKVHRNLL